MVTEVGSSRPRLSLSQNPHLIVWRKPKEIAVFSDAMGVGGLSFVLADLNDPRRRGHKVAV